MSWQKPIKPHLFSPKGERNGEDDFVIARNEAIFFWDEQNMNEASVASHTATVEYKLSFYQSVYLKPRMHE